MHRHRRIVATVLALVGLAGAAASLDVTSAGWNDNANFRASLRSGQWVPTTTTSPTTTTTTTTLPPTLPGDPNGGISPGNADTVISGITWNLNGSRQFCTEVRIRGASTTARPWAITIDLTQPPFYGVGTGGVQTNSTGVVTVVNPQTLRITGNGPYSWPWDPRQNNTPITSSQTALLTICAYNAPVPPPAHPSTYAVTYTHGTWTATQACVVATITTTRHDLSAFPFYYGWSIPIDLTAAKALITNAGNTLNYVGWSPYPNGPTDGTATPATFTPPLDSYTFTSGFNNVLRAAGGGADTRTVTACVFGYSGGGNGNGGGKGNGGGGGNNARVAAGPEEESTGTTTTVAAAPTLPTSTTMAPTTVPTTMTPGSVTTTTGVPTTTSAPSPATTVPPSTTAPSTSPPLPSTTASAP